MSETLDAFLGTNGESVLPVVEANPGDGVDLDMHRNPAALATLRLLEQVHGAHRELSEGEIIQNRVGGIYPARTVDEVAILTRLGLLNEVDTNPTRVKTSKLGEMELALNNVLSKEQVEQSLKAALASLKEDPPELPAEKYGNEEFRFTWESVYELLMTIYEHNAYRKINIAAVGSPMIGVFMSRCPSNIGNVCIFDINGEIVDSINELGNKKQKKGKPKSKPRVIATEYNALDQFPPSLGGRFDAFIMDPPWHNEHYCLFTDRAWEALRKFGRVYMSMFSPDTRQEASKELKTLFQRFMAGGFGIISVIPEFFGYSIPEFEKAVFKANGIDVSSRGNYGQLVVLERGLERDETCITPEMTKKLVEERCIQLAGKSGKSSSLWLPQESTPKWNVPLNIEIKNNGQVYTTTSRSQRRVDGVNLITGDHIGVAASDCLKLVLLHIFWAKNISVDQCVNDLKREQGYSEIDEEIIRADVECAFDFFNSSL